MLETIFGTPPSPPPDVVPIGPDTRGTPTIREQLKKDRHVQACSDCHSKIDPLGFSMEFYDPIGGLREKYPKMIDGEIKGEGLPIDGSGHLPSGERFNDKRDLKRLLLSRKEQFALTVTEKPLNYGTGRQMAFRDHEEIQRIVTAAGTQGYGLRVPPRMPRSAAQVGTLSRKAAAKGSLPGGAEEVGFWMKGVPP
jgi:hypothetical protein